MVKWLLYFRDHLVEMGKVDPQEPKDLEVKEDPLVNLDQLEDQVSLDHKGNVDLQDHRERQVYRLV